VGSRDVELRIPGVLGRLGVTVDHPQLAALEVDPPPMVDQLGTRDAHQPGHRKIRGTNPVGRRDSRHERLCRQLLG
jgi:hypothetical protein